ncbi:hypothetical protein [Streptomyces hokutonensis]
MSDVTDNHRADLCCSWSSSNYLAPLFKNTTKCRDLVAQVEAKSGSG